MRTLFSSILLCSTLAFATPASADEASHRAAVLEYFKLADMEKFMNETMDQMLQAQVQMNPGMTPYQQLFKDFLAKYMAWKVVEPEFVTLYMKAFTEAEMKQMLAFYRTPIGKKALRETPRLMQQGGQIGAKRVQENMSELMQQMQQVKQKMSSQPAPPPAAPK